VSVAAKRPRVVCHMIATVDGRIVTNRWPDIGEGLREYERTASTYEADAWMCGRVTMEHFAGAVRDEEALAREAPGAPDRADYTAPGAHAPYAIALDARGRLRWSRNEIDGDHVVMVMSDRVPDAVLASLRETSVSYLLVPTRESAGLDVARALEKLSATFGIRTLLLEGGGGINGTLLRDGLIDELSLLVAPIADGSEGAASLFDVPAAPPDRRARRLVLESVERRPADVLWLRYRVGATS
jgi:2,5-diamino-6-(ribosylamino)-4(3H)-pyrimidinone 5'-phosphate reductase